jgi:hypothetical protein
MKIQPFFGYTSGRILLPTGAKLASPTTHNGPVPWARVIDLKRISFKL